MILKDIKTIFIILIVASLMSCKDDTTISPETKQLNALKNGGKSWIIGTSGKVIKDDFDVTEEFEGFQLTIGSYTYTTENSLEAAWSETGTWEFYQDDLNTIQRGDDVLITLSVSGTDLILTFTVTDSAGRTSSIGGKYEFHLVSE